MPSFSGRRRSYLAVSPSPYTSCRHGRQRHPRNSKSLPEFTLRGHHIMEMPMDSRIYSVAVAFAIVTTSAAAQTITNPNTTVSPGASSPTDSTAPSPPTSTTGQNATGSSETPANVSPSPVEQNRLDPSAPSAQRLIIDPGTAAGSTTTNPADNSSNPGAPGRSYNAIQERGSSNNGTSTGTSGLGVTPAPSPLSPSMYPQPLTTPPTPNPASNYPAPLTNPVFAQPTTTPGAGLGTHTTASGIGAGSSLQDHATSHATMPSSHMGGGHMGGGGHR